MIHSINCQLMTLVSIIAAIHFILGAAGILIQNRRLGRTERKKNWTKYFVYLLIFVVVSASVLLGRFVFLLLCEAIVSAIIFELLSGFRKAKGDGIKHSRKFVSSVTSVFILAIALFSAFVFLPLNLVFSVYLAVVIFDGASQVTGQLAGRHKILPKVSPSKTWEGFAGGLLSVSVTTGILHEFLSLTVITAIAFGICISITAFAGDMSASWLKRQLGLKDFGKTLPGQGGFADRFDSFISAAALTSLVLLIFSGSVFQPDWELIKYILFSSGLLAVVLTGELLLSVLKLKAEYTRIFNHISAGLITLFLPLAFSSTLIVSVLCLQSALFLFLARSLNMFHSLSGVRRVTFGESLFFLGVLLCWFISWYSGRPVVFYIPVLILTFSDPVAALAGMSYGTRRWPRIGREDGGQKTFAGSTGFFISTVIIISIFLFLFTDISNGRIIAAAFSCSAAATIAEAYSNRGFDNVTVPLACMLPLILVYYF
jgi:phosphatidate cytidylyltransferase